MDRILRDYCAIWLFPLWKGLMPATDGAHLTVMDGTDRQRRSPVDAIAFTRKVDMLGDRFFADSQYRGYFPIGLAAGHPIDAVALALRQPGCGRITFRGKPCNPPSRLKRKTSDEFRSDQIPARERYACLRHKAA